MTDENKSTALALNSDEVVNTLIKEVQDEFITSDREVYKAGLRSLLIQEQKLVAQKVEMNGQIDAELKQLSEARDALTVAFKEGILHSVADARGVVRKVNKKIAMNDIDDEFGA